MGDASRSDEVASRDTKATGSPQKQRDIICKGGTAFLRTHHPLRFTTRG